MKSNYSFFEYYPWAGIVLSNIMFNQNRQSRHIPNKTTHRVTYTNFIRHKRKPVANIKRDRDNKTIHNITHARTHTYVPTHARTHTPPPPHTHREDTRDYSLRTVFCRGMWLLSRFSVQKRPLISDQKRHSAAYESYAVFQNTIGWIFNCIQPVKNIAFVAVTY